MSFQCLFFSYVIHCDNEKKKEKLIETLINITDGYTMSYFLVNFIHEIIYNWYTDTLMMLIAVSLRFVGFCCCFFQQLNGLNAIAIKRQHYSELKFKYLAHTHSNDSVLECVFLVVVYLNQISNVCYSQRWKIHKHFLHVNKYYYFLHW